jgi:TetR/AcrR family transcriptional regulator, transcriptional repressor for nem operon
LSIVSQVTDLPIADRRTKGSQRRDALVSAARTTLHEQGVHRTTLADVAATAGVPVGNLYYYFKTKDDIVGAVLDSYDNDYPKIRQLLDAQPTPQDRLKTLVRLLIGAKDRITAHGCPIGSLCSELDKRDDALSARGAEVLGRLVAIATAEFTSLGRTDARELGIALIAAYEGAALLANTLRDPGILTGEAARLEHWIDSLT